MSPDFSYFSAGHTSIKDERGNDSGIQDGANAMEVPREAGQVVLKEITREVRWCHVRLVYGQFSAVMGTGVEGRLITPACLVDCNFRRRDIVHWEWDEKQMCRVVVQDYLQMLTFLQTDTEEFPYVNLDH